MKNKKLLSILFIIVLIFGITPYFIGNMVKDNIEQQSAQLSQMPGYTLKLSDYDQGWFTSRAVLSYGFDEHTLKIMAESEDTDQEILDILNKGIVINIRIAHGPLTFQNGINFALMTMTGELQDIDHEAYKTFLEKAKIDNLLDLFASVSYLGKTSITMNSPAFKADYSDIADKILVVDSEGLNVQATINSSYDEYSAIVEMGKIDIKMDDGTVTFNQINIQADGNKINEYLWIGNGLTVMEEFSITDPKGMSFSLNNFSSEYAISKESDTTLAINMTFHAGNITANDISLKELQFDFSLNRLNLEAITNYVKSINEIYKPANGETATAEQIAADLQLVVIRAGEELIKKSPELNMGNFNFLMGDGHFNSDGRISLNGEGLDNIMQLSDPAALNKRLAATVNIKFDKALALELTAIGIKEQLTKGGVDLNEMPPEQLSQMIDVQTSTALQAFITQGYIKLEDEEYSIHFDMKDGQKLINEKPLPIPGM